MIKTRVWICLLGGCSWRAWRSSSGPRKGPVGRNLVRRRFGARVSLAQDQSFTVDSPYGSNTVTIQNGAIAVTQSDCPGGDCIQTGWAAGGQPIVCLPHRLVVQFSGGGGPDAVTG